VTGVLPLPEVEAAQVAVEDASGTLTHGQVAGAAARLRARVPPGAVVALRARRARTVVTAITALDGWAARVDLLGSVDAGEPAPGTVVLDDALVSSAAPVPAPPVPAPVDAVGAGSRLTSWRLYTSGTTGAPTAVDHTLASLTRTVRRSAGGSGERRAARRWGLLYEPTRMAGAQVLLQCLVGGDHLLDATAHERLPDRLRWLSDRRVDALSATPTVWRQVLQSADPRSLDLAQVTLGGEIADQGLLDALARTFPRSRVTHVFASTETGAAFAVSDGREGFPRAHLVDPPRGVRLDVRDGVLFVHAPEVSGAGPDGFVGTGDLVEVTDDRVRYLGRASGVVKVGGVTVSPEQVEGVLRAHPGVADAVVRPRRNPFSGWILSADVVPGADADAARLPALLRAWTGQRLSSAHAPASIRLVTELSTSATGKAGRR
jgi:acyl-coenzyme A synthetase/AMP-(fatty) acid ligase